MTFYNRWKRKPANSMRNKTLPVIASADPNWRDNEASRFVKAAALCMSCCLPSHSIICSASASVSQWLSLAQNTKSKHFSLHFNNFYATIWRKLLILKGNQGRSRTFQVHSQEVKYTVVQRTLEDLYLMHQDCFEQFWMPRCSILVVQELSTFVEDKFHCLFSKCCLQLQAFGDMPKDLP